MKRLISGIKAVALLGFIVIPISTPTLALDAGQVNGAAVGMTYREARARLLEFGYEGAFLKGKQKCLAPRAICKAYSTEVQDCAGTGEAPCKFVFKYPRGRTVVVMTKGEDLRVSSIFEQK
jgi:hypothetical protein